MSLLPSRDPAAPDADPRVIPVDSDDADEVLSALSAETARNLLSELHEEPAPPGELADRVDTSLQNAKYHLDKLEAAGAVAVVDTAYSEKGREMDVYAPADQPLVICAGDEQETSGVRSALTSLLGGVGVLAVLSVAVQQVLGKGVGSLLGPGVQSGSAGGSEPTTNYAAGPSSPYIPTGMTAEAVADGGSAAQSAGEAAVGLPPGLLFFAGGAVVLAAMFALWYAQQ